MNFEELLKAQGLSDEQIKSITKAMSKEKIYTTTEEKADDRIGKLKSQKEDLEEQLNTANTTIKDLKKNNADNEELQKTIKQHEDTIKTLKTDSDTKIRNLTLDSAISNALTKAKAKHSDLLSSKFDRDKLVINEDGTVTGLDEQLKGFKETYKDMFEVTLGGGTPPNPDNKPTTITRDQFNKMGYLERVKLNQDDPELYNTLKGEE
ncbi:phage scaffolding protein [Clostridium sardiniense]|uniref:Phage scaffolding protein n=1 Tax=Clostridium sardiniense TaxID=29369 RepID=A0ABS7KWD2_CLOSR|nr:phage scaffolding protein [Clostridium sardiniense]MBY0755029.1 phage scaffolding protein [Clostridium sardiniense]MDQ0459116.1 chromosome segregation ATPase [Clostridium sardiniense]